ncbi:zinc finger MYM-type protein 6 [Trichonephila clavipes]|nr:zinc finger MYM-type protein 6 [Trichonephila clavipes]
MRTVRDGTVIKGCGSHLVDMRTKSRPTKRPKIIADVLLRVSILEGKTTGEKIFEVINEYFEAKSLSWENCVAVCTAGAAALRGSNKGLRGLIQKVAPHVVFNHCMIHRQALVAKDMDEDIDF